MQYTDVRLVDDAREQLAPLDHDVRLGGRVVARARLRRRRAGRTLALPEARRHLRLADQIQRRLARRCQVQQDTRNELLTNNDHQSLHHLVMQG